MTVISTLHARTLKEATRAAAMLDSAETDVIAKVGVLFLMYIFLCDCIVDGCYAAVVGGCRDELVMALFNALQKGSYMINI